MRNQLNWAFLLLHLQVAEPNNVLLILCLQDILMPLLFMRGRLSPVLGPDGDWLFIWFIVPEVILAEFFVGTGVL